MPATLRVGKEPSTLMADYEKLVELYYAMLVEARVAVTCRDVSPLAAYLKKVGDAVYLDLPADFRNRVADRISGHEAGSAQLDKPSPVLTSD